MKNVKKKSGWDMTAFIGFCLLCLVGYAVFQPHKAKRREPSSPVRATSAASSAKPKASSRQALQTAFADLDSRRVEHERLMGLMAAGDSEAEMLMAFHRSHGVYVRLAPNAGVAFSSRESAQRLMGMGESPVGSVRDFAIATSSFEERRINGFAFDSAWQFDGQYNLLHTPSVLAYTDVWAASTLFHELRHAYDLCSGIEPPRSQGRDWVRGELRAYAVEFRLLDRFTHGKWTGNLDRILGIFDEDTPLPPEVSIDTIRVQPRQIDFDSFIPLFPQMRSVEERTIRQGAIYIALNLRARERRGLGEEAMIRAYSLVHSPP